MRLFFFISLLFGILALHAQEKRTYTTIRTENRPKIDGNLSDSCWINAPDGRDFTQYTPYNGAAPTQQTSVKIIYDNDAIYIGAMMYDSAPDSIKYEMGLRDDWDLNSDNFIITFLPYNDGINGVKFGITASGVQLDALVSGDNSDDDWNGTWRAKVKRLENGWSAELLIPYTDLRFPEKDIQLWGLNLWREIRRNREESAWNYVNNEISGTLKQSGELAGIEHIDPPLRLALLPYVSSYLNSPASSDEWLSDFNYGMDLKWGINESFTLDMTLIPDFGQVKSDDKIYNLSPDEIYYGENRPFFTEGIDLFDKGDILYSRRIGKAPVNFDNAYSELDDHEVVQSNPQATPLFNAVKVSGRTNTGLGIGVMNALTQPTFATILDTLSGEKSEVMTQDWANYNMLVLDQSLKNNSYISLYNTNVNYFGFYRMANVSGIEFSLRNKENSYAIYGKNNVSQLYYSDSTQLGMNYYVSFYKSSGNFRFSFDHGLKTDQYNPNDMGYNSRNNRLSFENSLSYNIYKPFGKFLSMNNSLYTEYLRQYDPDQFMSLSLYLISQIKTVKNYFIRMTLNVSPTEQYDAYEARTQGQGYYKSPFVRYTFMLSPDYNKRFVVDLGGEIKISPEYNENSLGFEIEPRFRVNDRMMLILSGEYSKTDNGRGYVEHVSDSIIFGSRDLNNVELVFETGYIFSPKMGVNLRLRQYWLSAKYNDYFALNSDGHLNPLGSENYNEDNNFNFSTFALDLSFSWEFAPGSNLSFVWKNDFEKFDNQLIENYFDNFSNMMDAPSSNSLSLKLLYYLDYSYLKRKNPDLS